MASLKPFDIAVVNPIIIPVGILNAANLFTASPACSPNNFILLAADRAASPVCFNCLDALADCLATLDTLAAALVPELPTWAKLDAATVAVCAMPLDEFCTPFMDEFI